MLKLYNGDCLEIMQEIPDGSVDMILCDLPYGTTDCKWDTIIPFAPLWENYNRVLKPNGVAVLFAAQPFTTKLIHSNLKNFRYCWYWLKNNKSGFAYARYQPMRQIEDICIFVLNNPTSNNKGLHAGLRKYFFDELKNSGLTRKDVNKLLNNSMSNHYFTNGEQFSIPSAENYKILQRETGCFSRSYDDIENEFLNGKKYGKQTYNPQGLKPFTGKQDLRKKTTDIYTMRGTPKPQKYTGYPTHVLKFNGVNSNSRQHPTQKPVALLEYLIKTYTNAGETVLDNCAGSGSTGVAALNINRKFIGIEKDRKYFDVMCSRIGDLYVNSAA